MFTTNVIIISIYRSHSGDFCHFLKKLGIILNLLYSNKIEYIICGDISVNYLDTCTKIQQLDTLSTTHNLRSTVNFPTRIVSSSVTAIASIFVDKARNYTISPFINRLSDHDAQLIKLNNVILQKQACETRLIRNINNHPITEFQLKVSYEDWDNIFGANDVSTSFNNLLNT